MFFSFDPNLIIGSLFGGQVKIYWENFSVRIIIIAPQILPSTLQYVDKISYPVDLIEINRWVEKANHFALVKKLEPEKQAPKVKPVKGLENYDEDFYKSHRNKESVRWFYKYIGEVDRVIKQKGWSLEKKFNVWYCAYKAGFFTAFRVHWISSKTFSFSFNLKPNDFKRIKLKGKNPRFRRRLVYFYIDPGKTKTSDFVALFELAYKKLTGA